MKTIDFSYFIERYNAGEMDEAEKEWFIRELKGNEKLRNEVELRKKTDIILKGQDLINLRNKLSLIEKQRQETPVSRHKPYRTARIKYAAAILILTIIGALFVISGGNMTSDEIIAQYYKPYEATSVSRSVPSADNSEYYTLAMDYYRNHDYRNAAKYFEKVLEKDPGNMQSELLNGISNFENQNYPEARGSFSKVIEHQDNYYLDHAQWYLALCYIKTEEKDKARDQLSLVEKSGTVYRKDARKILRRLR